MKHEEKIEFISKQFENEKQQIPISLEKENVVSMLKSVEISKNKKARVMPLGKYISAAAALVIIVVAAVFSTKIVSDDNMATESATIGNTVPVVCLPSEEKELYAKIEEYFVDEHNRLVEESESISDDIGVDFINEGATTYDSQTSAKTADLYGQTNTQVVGIDEGDIVKNDGRYIYTVSKNRIYIVDTEKMEQVAVISDFVSDEKNSEFETNIDEIYVKDDIMTVISTETERYTYSTYVDDGQDFSYDCIYPTDTSKSKTYITFYDISNRQNPKKQSQHNQSGNYYDSRMIGDIIYTVGYYTVNVSCEKTESQIRNECVPKVDGKRINAENIEFSSYDTNGIYKNYVVISSFDMSEKTKNNSSYTYLGDVDTLYMSSKRLYIVSSVYDILAVDSNSGSGYRTVITALKLDNGKITFDCEGFVNGNANNQYSMDEYNGYFRIATTDFKEQNDDVIDISSVYVLDKNLNTVGKLVDIAKNESVKSVRFMNDTAYIVTYENTDPLFVIDLCDPTDPKITGKVELPGFSDYLHPIGEKYIVGVGYDGDDEGADFTTLKITLFDVSDPKNPKVCDDYIIENAETDVNYDPKAFVYYPEKQLIGVPVIEYDAKNKSQGNYYFIGIKDGNLYEQAILTHSFDKYNAAYAEFFRGTYISDVAYTLTEKGICSFDINTAEKLGQVKFEEGN